MDFDEYIKQNHKDLFSYTNQYASITVLWLLRGLWDYKQEEIKSLNAVIDGLYHQLDMYGDIT